MAVKDSPPWLEVLRCAAATSCSVQKDSIKYVQRIQPCLLLLDLWFHIRRTERENTERHNLPKVRVSMTTNISPNHILNPPTKSGTLQTPPPPPPKIQPHSTPPPPFLLLSISSIKPPSTSPSIPHKSPSPATSQPYRQPRKCKSTHTYIHFRHSPP